MSSYVSICFSNTFRFTLENVTSIINFLFLNDPFIQTGFMLRIKDSFINDQKLRYNQSDLCSLDPTSDTYNLDLEDHRKYWLPYLLGGTSIGSTLGRVKDYPNIIN